MNQIEELLKLENGPNQAARLAVKLSVTESYIRALANGKTPGWRLEKAIETLYNKEMKNAEQ